tara:strand:+ start:2392 stop:2610 length:219 start_codon:yes stop_codon:yes gene_type:complete
MEKIIKLNNRNFVTKSSATRLLGFSNHNSIDDLVRRRKMQEFKIQGLAKSLILLDEIKSHPRFIQQSSNLLN